MAKQKPLIGITFGDPAGIGPEIIAKALNTPSVRSLANFLIIGDYRTFQRYQKTLPKNTTFLDLKNIAQSHISFGRINRACGKAAMEYLDVAIGLLKTKSISALVTAPLCKEAVQLSDPHFKGHTEYLAQSFGVKKFDMMFVLDDLKVVIATRHTPLKDIPKEISRKLICKTISLTAKSLQRYFRIADPKIAVCGLNPHAGEGGNIGCEEVRIISPAIKHMKSIFPNVQGPFAADTLFYTANASRYDAIIAMYHDQGLAPIKTTNFYKLVNFTVGLPVIRTSPAHGTAFNIVGKNKADPSSMCESIRLAVRLAR